MFVRLNLKSHQTYLESFRAAVEAKLRSCYDTSYSTLTTRQVAGTLSIINAYPNLAQVKRNPDHLPHYDALAEKISTLEEHLTKLFVLGGYFFTEHTVGGIASRLNQQAKETYGVEFGPKYLIMPKMLTDATKIDGYSDLLDISLGERHMLQFAFCIYKLSKEMGGEHWTNVLNRQKMLIVPNQKDESPILESFQKYGFFGFNPEHVMFATSRFYKGLQIENGILSFNPEIEYVHNHAVVPMQTCMEDVLFTIDKNGQRTIVPRWRYREILASMQDRVSYNVEDLDFLKIPIDYKGLAIAMRFSLEGYRMVMEIMQQRTPPQPGGMLCFDPDLIDPFTKQKGRLVVIEGYQLGPEVNKKLTEALKTIQWLNRNQNHYPFPVESYDVVADGGLPILIDVKKHADGSLGIYNNAPQGDLNFMLRTAYIVRNSSITSLKDIKDIETCLKAMKKQQDDPDDGRKEWKAFVSQFADAGQSFPDIAFTEINKIAPHSPLEIETLLRHPWFTARSEKRYLEQLRSLSEVFKVQGSLVYHARQEGDRVFLQLAPDSKRGQALRYHSRAEEKEIEALDIKNWVFKGNRIWTGHLPEGDFSGILISNRKAGENEGEIVLLVGSYNETLSNERKSFLLEVKLEKVIEYAMTKSREEFDAWKKLQIINEFNKLPWQFLFENSATTIEERIAEEIKKNA
jgi:hypothetical protein